MISMTNFQPYVKTGSISGGINGPGTFTRTASMAGNVETVTTQVDYANGKTGSRTVTMSDSNGTITKNISVTGADGKTTTTAETIGPAAKGTRAITGTVTGANGKTDALSGNITNTGGTIDTMTTLTNQQGLSATRNYDATTSGSTTTTNFTGTNFSQGSLASETIVALITSQT